MNYVFEYLLSFRITVIETRCTTSFSCKASFTISLNFNFSKYFTNPHISHFILKNQVYIRFFKEE